MHRPVWAVSGDMAVLEVGVFFVFYKLVILTKLSSNDKILGHGVE